MFVQSGVVAYFEIDVLTVFVCLFVCLFVFSVKLMLYILFNCQSPACNQTLGSQNPVSSGVGGYASAYGKKSCLYFYSQLVFVEVCLYRVKNKPTLNNLQVLETCMKNCGKRFHSEVGKFRFLNELIKVVSPKVMIPVF